MYILYNRLITALNEKKPDSTEFYIAKMMIWNLNWKQYGRGRRKFIIARENVISQIIFGGMAYGNMKKFCQKILDLYCLEWRKIS